METEAILILVVGLSFGGVIFLMGLHDRRKRRQDR